MHGKAELVRCLDVLDRQFEGQGLVDPTEAFV